MLARSRYRILIAVVICAGVIALTLISVPPLRRAMKTAARKSGLLPMFASVSRMARLSEVSVPGKEILPPERLSSRRHTLTALHRALERNDYQTAAFLNSLLAQEAFQRAKRTLKAWETLRDPETGLVPKSIRQAFWNPKDAAADLYPFLLLASQYLDKENNQQWRGMLAKEREICGPMPCSIGFLPTRVIPESRTQVIFGASEYAKDGLLSIAERSGRGPWFVRLEETARALIEAAHVETSWGKIVASDTEVNGNMLQVLARLYWATRKWEYLQMAERIAEAYLFEVLPKNRYLPAMSWDFSTGQPAVRKFHFRDHGNEIIAGLAEVYFMEKMQQRPQATRYRGPLKKLLDLILVVGRTDDGLWYNSVDSHTGQPLETEVVDTWGYILNAYHTFDLADGTSIYAREIKRTMRAAAARKSFAWEGQHPDGYADAIESMLYLLPWFDLAECHQWVDDEIEVMFHMQWPSGFVVQGHLDGNFIRTSLLYAFYKTQGVIADPWREDVYLGAAYDRSNKKLYVHLSAGGNWDGLLKFDFPRHRAIWHLPLEYPRLNGAPEWFVVEPKKTYAVSDLRTGKTAFHSGQSLAEGLTIRLTHQQAPLLLTISEQ